MLKDARVYTGLQTLPLVAATLDSALASASASVSDSASVLATAAMLALASTSENKQQHDSEESSYEPGDESSESEESQPAKLKKQEYYSATTYESNRHQWLCHYFCYVQLPDAGYKNISNFAYCYGLYYLRQ